MVLGNTPRTQTLHHLLERRIALDDCRPRNVGPEVAGKLDEEMAIADGEAADGTPRSETLNGSFRGLVQTLLIQVQANVLTRAPASGLPCRSLPDTRIGQSNTRVEQKHSDKDAGDENLTDEQG